MITPPKLELLREAPTSIGVRVERPLMSGDSNKVLF
jgi:hypothetical protein